MAIQPYKISIDQSELDELHRRLKVTRWPQIIKETPKNDWHRGVPQSYLKGLVDYWLNDFDWRKQEAWLNQYPQFMATIEGQNIHFFHVRSKEENALPLMLLHGWPSSNVEFVNMIDQLTNPVTHGGKAEDAFDVVIPSAPGFCLSSPAIERWDSIRISELYKKLMHELGYKRWGVHGGDVGSDIAGEINHIEKSLVGVHVSSDMPAIIWYAGFTGRDPADNPSFSEKQKQEIAELKKRSAEDGGYLEIQRTRPLTMGYLLNDTPVGQLAWVIEKIKLWTSHGEKLPEDTIDIDVALTNVTLYWLTQGGATVADMLSANLDAERDWARPSYAPMGFAVFSALDTARALQDPEKQISHWSEFKKGGHFPALEVPELLAGDLRAFFGKLR